MSEELRLLLREVLEFLNVHLDANPYDAEVQLMYERLVDAVDPPKGVR